ncbi:MAG: acetate/propionate family kinase [Pseudomonadota bacterium]|nr:acetate/propionate family kinase [Pseudomonadota bacterium]
MNVLALNSGSSSLKFGLYDVRSVSVAPLVSGQAEAIGEANSRFHAEDSRRGVVASEADSIADQRGAVLRLVQLLATLGFPSPAAVGHRIVHGGPKLRRHCRIDDAVLRELEAATPYAPLHMPPALAVIRFAEEHFPGIAQVACFDTTFHAGMPEVSRTLAIPKELRSQGIRRYGFHGLSCESIVRQLADRLPGRLLIAHLGNGASVTAVGDGRSIDTSMGLTPSGGLIMGTRSGDLDPGVLIYLLREKGFDAGRLEDMVDHRAGLLGISGVAGDMRRLHEQAAANDDARLAIEMFCYSVRKELAAMTAVLGGVEAIVFTGGIGENDPDVRSAICAGLAWAGIRLDESRNRASNGGLISEPSSSCAVHVLASQEDEQIARHAAVLL